MLMAEKTHRSLAWGVLGFAIGGILLRSPYSPCVFRSHYQFQPNCQRKVSSPDTITPKKLKFLKSNKMQLAIPDLCD